MHEQNEEVNKEIEIQELKNNDCMKNSIESFNSKSTKQKN